MPARQRYRTGLQILDWMNAVDRAFVIAHEAGIRVRVRKLRGKWILETAGPRLLPHQRTHVDV